MKSRALIRRALAGLLSLAAVLTLSVWPAPTSVRADETDFDTSNTAFTEPQWDTGMMYFWHEGLPRKDTVFDANGNVVKYPLLVTWDDKYYFCYDSSFNSQTTTTFNSKPSNSSWNFGVYTEDMYDRIFSILEYVKYTSYSMSDDALLAKAGFDVNTLFTLGEAVSMQTPLVPEIVMTDPANDRYALAAPESVCGKERWFVASLRTNEWVPTSWGTDDLQRGEAWPILKGEKWAAYEFLDPDYVYQRWRTIYDVKEHVSYLYQEVADNHYWTIKKDTSGRYHFWTTGESDVDFGRISGSDTNRNIERIRGWFYASDLARAYLAPSGSKLVLHSQDPAVKDWEKRVNNLSTTGNGFRVFYADPNVVSFYKNSFTVEDGQVVSLEGPLVIDPKCTVTVKPGGVLSCSGWIINDGQILVEPGGMLIVQERQTATGDKQYGAITSLETMSGDGAGRIACDGIMIVNEDCKVVGCGCYGLQFGEGAQVVNYGQIIAENLDVYTDHTIENRGDSSAVFAGWGVTNSGYSLTRTRIAGTEFLGKGNREKVAVVKIPTDAIYGPGASRVYYTSASLVSRDTGIANRTGYVSGFQAKIRTQLWEQPELPPNIPIYLDDRYGVSFIEIVDADLTTKIFHYYADLNRYVLVSEGGTGQTFYDYSAPAKTEEYIQRHLPDGYRLADGRVVGQAEPPENIRYDPHANVWFFTAGDGHVYYWEEALNAYISVDKANQYHVLTEDAAPPIKYASGYTPGDFFEDVPAGMLRYQEGMEQSTGEFVEYEYDPNAKPKVQKDEDGRYYVIYDGRYGVQPYYWFSSSPTGFYFGGQPVNYLDYIDLSEVDLNGYKLP